MRFLLVGFFVWFASGVQAAEMVLPFTPISKVGPGSRQISMAVDSNDRVHFVFSGCGGGDSCNQSDLMYGVIEPKDALEAPGARIERVAGTGADDAWFGALALTGTETAHILFAHYSEMKLRHAYRETREAKWNNQEAASGKGGWWNAAAFDSNGDLWAANTSFPKESWEYPGLSVGHWSDGKWSFNLLDQGPEVGWFPAIAAGPAGMMAITYVSGGYPIGRLNITRRSISGEWEHDWVDRDTISSSVVMDAEGTVHVAYQQGWGSNIDSSNLMYGRSSEKGKWDIVMVDGDENHLSETGARPKLVLDRDGTPHVLYRDYRAGCLAYAHPKTSEPDAWTERWKVTKCLGRRGNMGLYPAAGFDSRGRLHVLFENGRELNYGILKPSISGGSL